MSIIIQYSFMEDINFRMKTEGAALHKNKEINIQKYGEQLKLELEEISKLMAKKNTAKNQTDSPTAHSKKTVLDPNSFGSKHKSINTQLEESIVRKSKDRERENRRNFIYEVESGRQLEDEEAQKQVEQPSSPKKESSKSPYSDTMSTTSSRSKNKSKDSSPPAISIQDFMLGKKLGEGKFGEVFIAQHKKSGFLCALKRISRSNMDQKMIVQLCREIKIQTFLNHPNIVKLYSFFSDQKAVYLVQELCSSGQLYTLLKKKRKLSQDLTKIIIQQICRALDYMHECEIIHRDLKPQNIIFHNGMVKICDFGWSISSKTMRQTFCGTPLYVSPELLKRKCYNNKIDVWSVGILAYELLFGRVPFQIVTQKDFIKIMQDELKFSKAMIISQQAKDFIKCCLNKDPRERYTIPQLLEHPFITLIENPLLSELY